MTIFLQCPYQACKHRYQVKYSEKIGEELTTHRDTALAELNKRVISMLKKDHKQGGHKRGQ